MKILLSGLYGHMGCEVEKLCEEGYKGAELTAGVDINSDDSKKTPCTKDFSNAATKVDCIIDFSHHSITKDLCDFAQKNNIPLVLATTGHTDEEKEIINETSKKIPLFFAANFSLGVALLCELAKKTAATFPDAEIEIVETHHDRKLDAPSGTALAIANGIKEVLPDLTFNCGRQGGKKRDKNEIGIHSLRMGNIAGIHEVIVCTKNQAITLKHEAYSRALFAEGALTAAAFLMGKEPGLYNMQSILDF